MTSEHSSTLTWLDSSESERRAVMELVSALNEPATLDELGIGAIRDTIADHLFPGTSTIQTRARYFLFIPWIMRMVEARPGGRPERLSRSLQLDLCDALDRAHGQGKGVIGRESRGDLRRWPLSIYWLGLERWSIRRRAATIPEYFGAMRRPSSWLQAARIPEEPDEGERYEAPDASPGHWAALPEPPEGFPDTVNFTLRPEESRFLRECIDLRNSHTYLAHILRDAGSRSVEEARYPWDLPSAERGSPSIRRCLADARNFSLVHQGASLLYNLMLAEGLGDERSREEFSGRFRRWSGLVQAAEEELLAWDRSAMWRRLREDNPRLRQRTTEFADRWYGLATSQSALAAGGGDAARRLVRERERSLKGMRAKLSYPDALANRRGYPTSARLEFRWTQVKRIAVDILGPLEGRVV